MLPELSKINRTPPSALIKREIKILGISVEELSERSEISLENIQNILNNNLTINAILSQKLGKALNENDNYFLEIQKLWDKELKYKEKNHILPNLAHIRPVVFWDEDFPYIDWNRNEKKIIRRIFERGNEIEKQEIISFYGKEKVLSVLQLFCNENLNESDSENLYQYHIPISF